jgi:hypothetical protein
MIHTIAVLTSAYILSNSGMAEIFIIAPAASVKSSRGFPDGLLVIVKRNRHSFGPH